MKQYRFSDDELRSAAASVRASMLAAAQALPNGEREFSESFLAEMDALVAAGKRRGKRRFIRNRVAGVALALLVGASMWGIADDGARTSFRNWARGVCENSVVYELFGRPPETVLRYELNWLPEGFVPESELDETDEKTKRKDMRYENAETGDAVCFACLTISKDVSVQISDLLGVPLTEAEPCTVNGLMGRYHAADGETRTNTLIWVDEERGIVYSLSGTLERDVLLRIAQNVVPVSTAR